MLQGESCMTQQFSKVIVPCSHGTPSKCRHVQRGERYGGKVCEVVAPERHCSLPVPLPPCSQHMLVTCWRRRRREAQSRAVKVKRGGSQGHAERQESVRKPAPSHVVSAVPYAVYACARCSCLCSSVPYIPLPSRRAFSTGELSKGDRHVSLCVGQCSEDMT